MMFQEHRLTRSIFLPWIGANLLGFLGMSALITVLPVPRFIPGFVVLILFFLPIGLAQWLVLRRRILLSPLWILTLPVGVLLSWLLVAAIPWAVIGDDESTLALTIAYVVIGAAIGLPQWLILRRKMSRTGLWIAGSGLGLGLGFGLVLVTGLINRSEFISYVAVVLVYGLATGGVLAWLLPHREEAYGQLLNVT
jgi:hypothetical protein